MFLSPVEIRAIFFREPDRIMPTEERLTEVMNEQLATLNEKSPLEKLTSLFSMKAEEPKSIDPDSLAAALIELDALGMANSALCSYVQNYSAFAHNMVQNSIFTFMINSARTEPMIINHAISQHHPLCFHILGSEKRGSVEKEFSEHVRQAMHTKSIEFFQKAVNANEFYLKINKNYIAAASETEPENGTVESLPENSL